MTHFSDAEFVDLMDDVLPLARRAHLQQCEACRARASEMDLVFARIDEHRGAGASDVPEPSPLFWEHLSARVREGLAGVPVKISRRERIWRPGTALAAGLASIALALAISHTMFPRGPLGEPSSVLRKAPAIVGPSASGSELSDDVESDDAWAVVRNVADQIDWDEARDAEISTRPDAAERMTAELTTREQVELARLLQRELNP